MSFYVSTATFFLLHCDEWDRVVALPRHKFVTGATLLQLAPPPKIGKNMIFFFAYNRDFLHEIPPKKLRLPPQLEKIWFFGVKSWFFTWNTPKISMPPSSRHNFFKCTPLTWNPVSAPVVCPPLIRVNLTKDLILDKVRFQIH